MVYAMHQIQVASIVRHGRSEWMHDYLTQIAEHELLLASATTETGIGGDVRSSSCAVERDGDRFRLEKDAPVISYGASRRRGARTARRTPDSPPNDQVLVVVPSRRRRSRCDRAGTRSGFRGTCSNGFLLRADGHVDQILADAYGEISSSTMLPTSHVVWASVWLGIAGNAVDIARSLRSRRGAAQARYDAAGRGTARRADRSLRGVPVTRASARVGVRACARTTQTSSRAWASPFA